MFHEDDDKSNTVNAGSLLTYQLTKDKAEIILIALNALYELQKNSNLYFQKMLVNGQQMFGLENLPTNLMDTLAKLCDEVYKPIHNINNPMSVNDYLLILDIDETLRSKKSN
jgi:hypothetical protein